MQKVLIYDNDELFRCNLKRVLESKCFYIQEASRPSEAVKYVLKERFDAIVFSLQPDDMNGTQIFSAIRSIDYKLPVIVVTDSNQPLSSVSSIIHESFRLFQKPVDCNEIEDAIREAVDVKADNK